MAVEKRTFAEAATYTLNRIRKMDLSNSNMLELMGMVTALQVLHEAEMKESKPQGKNAMQNIIETLICDIFTNT